LKIQKSVKLNHIKLEVIEIEVVKNADGKTVCRADGTSRIVEIVQKGFKTIIRFTPDGTYQVENLNECNKK